MPDALKSILVDDWENVTKNYQLVKLPAKHTVNRVLDDYFNQEKHRRDDPASFDLLEEVIAGLREYFNRSLGRILLYKYERGQYEDLLARIDDKADDIAGFALADVYGTEHFLRLLGKNNTILYAAALLTTPSINAGTHRSDKYGSTVCITSKRRTA
jgi:mortality factor 4-like protein 1